MTLALAVGVRLAISAVRPSPGGSTFIASNWAMLLACSAGAAVLIYNPDAGPGQSPAEEHPKLIGAFLVLCTAWVLAVAAEALSTVIGAALGMIEH